MRVWNNEDQHEGHSLLLKPVVKKGMKERGDSKTVQSVQSNKLTVTVVATNSDPTIKEQVFRKQ